MTEGARVHPGACFAIGTILMTDTLLRTPLYALHLELGAKMVPFAGYEMPVQYPAGVLKEHLHTRASAGLKNVLKTMIRRTIAPQPCPVNPFHMCPNIPGSGAGPGALAKGAPYPLCSLTGSLRPSRRKCAIKGRAASSSRVAA